MILHNENQYELEDGEFEQEANISHPLDLVDVSFSERARMTIREAVEKIAEYCRIPAAVLSEKLDQKLFRLEPSGILVISIEVPEVEADMFIEVPPGHWWVKQEGGQA